MSASTTVVLTGAALALRDAGCDVAWIKQYVTMGSISSDEDSLLRVKTVRRPQASPKGRAYLGLASQRRPGAVPSSPTRCAGG